MKNVLMVGDALRVASCKAIRTAFSFSVPLGFFDGASGVDHGFLLVTHGYNEGFASRLILVFFGGGK